MKAVILAGGLGTRLSEETVTRPKPMVEIGGRPILWHIMKTYGAHGIDEFVICCGYKGYMIKEYFANYFLHQADVTFDLAKNDMQVHQHNAAPWRVTLVDTGEATMTGGRIKRVRDYIGDETFCLTYGDGVSDVDIGASIAFHRAHGRQATLTAVQPPGRFGALQFADETRIDTFTEKPTGEGGWVNGGYFVLDASVIDRIAGDDTTWEREPLESLARDGEIEAFKHHGFWQPMDTLRDRTLLETMWERGEAPWRVWS
jgi:glucose-1-phosphate cytidylyltransferase